jgi:cephalosporin-C deacetylase-like acetyl esterase
MSGSLSISATLEEPGFLQCQVELKSAEQGDMAKLAGAAIDPLEIEPSLPAPEDFDAFWDAEKKKLAAIPPNIRLTPVKSPVAGVECFDVQADSVGGSFSGYFARPLGAKPKTLPAIILPHGAGVMSSYLGVAAQWAKEGFIALDFNVHGLPNGQPHEFYEKLGKGELFQYFLKDRESREKFFFHDAFLRVIRGIDVLAAQPEWDEKILIADGRSQGGGQAIAAAGLDSRVTFLCAEIPALCDHTGIVARRTNGWPRLLGWPKLDGPLPDERILQASRYYDAVNLAARIKVPAFFTVGFVDRVCPPTGVYAAYNQISSAKSILLLPHYGHQKSPEGDEGVRQAITGYLGK